MILGATVLVLVVGATLVVLNRSNLDSNEAGVVDGHPVTVQELEAFSEAHSLPLATHDEIAKAVTAIVSYKVMQAAALKRGLVSSISYSAMLTAMKSKNAANAKAITNHQATYGVASYTPETFLSYEQSTLQQALLTDLVSKKVIDPTGGELAAYYRDHKSAYAKNQDTVSLDLIRFEASSAGNAQLQSVFTRLDAGTSFNVIFADYLAGDRATVVDIEPMQISQDNAYSLSKYDNGIFTVGNQLKINATQVVQNDLAGGLVVLHCIDRQTAGYRSATDVADETAQRYEAATFTHYLARLVSDATVVVNNRLDQLVTH